MLVIVGAITFTLYVFMNREAEKAVQIDLLKDSTIWVTTSDKRHLQLLIREVSTENDSLKSTLQVYFEENKETKLELNAKNRIIRAKSKELLECEAAIRRLLHKNDSLTAVMRTFQRGKSNN